MARAKECFIFNKLRESVNPSLHVATDLEFLRVSYGNGGMARISCFRGAVGDVFRYYSPGKPGGGVWRVSPNPQVPLSPTGGERFS